MAHIVHMDEAVSGSSTGRAKNGRFVKGSSGNPSGLPKIPTSRVDAWVGHDAPHLPDEDGGEDGFPSLERLDGWASVLTGIGDPSRDKRLSHHHHSPHALSYEQAGMLWETDDMAAAAIEAPGKEIFREGYEITIGDEGSYDDLKETTEEKLLELGVDEAVELALAYERAYGGGAILLGADDGRPLDQPLDPASVGSIDWINVLEPIEITPASYYEDSNAAKYGKAEYYQLNQTGFVGPVLGLSTPPPMRGSVYIHESRLEVFGGIRVSKRLRSMNAMSQFWGTPELLRFSDALRDFNISWSSAGIISTDVSQPVISMNNLMQLVANHPEKLRARIQAMEIMRSTARALVIDSKLEKFERVTTNLAGLPDLLDRICLRLAAAVRMPLSVLMGYVPGGLGQPGETELTQWYNQIRSLQRRKVGPVIRRIAKMVMRTLRQRKLPKKWGVRWNELVRQTDDQRATSRLTQARADSMYVKMGSVTPDEIRRTRFVGEYSFETQVQEKKKAPGFLAPLPPGVMPGSTIAGASGPNGHNVGGYTRRNPTQSGLGANATEGGDNATEAGTRDAMDYTAVNEVADKKAALARAQGPSRRTNTTTIALLEQLVAIAEQEAAACAAGTCGPDCCYDHPDRADADGPGAKREFAGMPIVIESPKGSKREWVDTDGTTGSTKMKYDYGYIENTVGPDNDSVDVYLGPSPDAPWVYVVHQMSKASDFTAYDEDKAMLGFDSANHARDAYLRQYDDDRFLGGMSQMPLEDFKRRLRTRFGGMVSNAQYDELDEYDIVEHLDRIEKRGAKWYVKSQDGGKDLGEYDTETEAIHRLAAIEYYKKQSAA